MRPEPLEARVVPAIVFAVDSNNNLVSFDTAAPGTLLTDLPITGLSPGEKIVDIDISSTTGEIYAIGLIDDGATRTGRLRKINPDTGALTFLGDFSNTLPDIDLYGIDFEPGQQESLHVVNSEDDHFEFTLAGADTVEDDASDPNQAERITALAFGENFGTANSRGYAYNAETQELTRFSSFSGDVDPIADINFGGFTVVPQSDEVLFDIMASTAGGSDIGWFGIRLDGKSQLFRVDLETAALTGVGDIGDGSRTFTGMAVQPYVAGPTIAANGKSATWTDVDGDAVKLTITKGTLAPTNFLMLGANTGMALSRLQLSDLAFTGSNVTITAKRGPSGGDGLVNVGAIVAPIDLGVVTVAGDLERILIGVDANPSLSVKALKLRSFLAADSAFAPGNAGSRLEDGAGSITVAGDFSGNLSLVGGKIGSIFIGGDLVSQGAGGGSLSGTGLVSKLVIKGSIREGGGSLGAFVFLPAIPSVTVGGSLIGGINQFTGFLRFSTVPGVKSVITIGGSVIGNQLNNGGIEFGDQTTIKIGGSVYGGLDSSGSIRPFAIVSDTTLKSITIGGSIFGGRGENGGVVRATRIGTMLVKGSIVGFESNPAFVGAYGVVAPATQAEAVAIGSLTVLGTVRHATIAAGIERDYDPITADAAIGTIKIGRDFVAGNIVAGIDPGNEVFGDSDDAFATPNGGNPAIVARIASITIGGYAAGSGGGAPDFFGILAEQIGTLSVSKFKLPLTAGKDDLTAGPTGDLRVREF